MFYYQVTWNKCLIRYEVKNIFLYKFYIFVLLISLTCLLITKITCDYPSIVIIYYIIYKTYTFTWRTCERAQYPESHKRQFFSAIQVKAHFGMHSKKTPGRKRAPGVQRWLIEPIPNVILQHNTSISFVRNGLKSASRCLFKTINDGVLWMDPETKILFRPMGGQDVRWIIKVCSYNPLNGCFRGSHSFKTAVPTVGTSYFYASGPFTKTWYGY